MQVVYTQPAEVKVLKNVQKKQQAPAQIAISVPTEEDLKKRSSRELRFAGQQKQQKTVAVAAPVVVEQEVDFEAMC
jgi:hypothetical protein